MPEGSLNCTDTGVLPVATPVLLQLKVRAKYTVPLAWLVSLTSG